MKDGYLLIYNEQDECHFDLISEDHYNKILTELNNFSINSDIVESVAFDNEPIKRYHIQTFCNEPWPYYDINIISTVSVPRT